MSKNPTPPAHLSAACKSWWRAIVRDYDLNEQDLRLLTMAAEAWDMNTQARQLLKKEGLTFTDDRGNCRAHPAVSIARDCKTTFARLIRELSLDIDPPPDSRPPRIAGAYAGRG